jgi:pimeloyl-ACP methyl ester carboxylesterase
MPLLAMPDGRTLAYELGGDPHGVPVFYQHGVPGSRLRQPLEPGLWKAVGVRAITYDRPGYGNSMRHEGRSVADCVGDVLAIAEAVEIGRFCVLGVSGGGPHALAVATLEPKRVASAALVVPAAPVEPEELELLIPINRSGYERARRGAAAVAEELVPLREQLLADPVGMIRAMLGAAATDEISRLATPEAIERAANAVAEGLRPGLEGWIDDSLAVEINWGFTPEPVRCPLSVWYAEDDTATPASAVLRLADHAGAALVHAWPDEGHLASLTHEREVLEDLLKKAREAALEPNELLVGWSLYGAPWLQPVATSGKSARPRSRKNKRIPLPPRRVRERGTCRARRTESRGRVCERPRLVAASAAASKDKCRHGRSETGQRPRQKPRARTGWPLIRTQPRPGPGHVGATTDLAEKELIELIGQEGWPRVRRGSTRRLTGSRWARASRRTRVALRRGL